MIPKISLEQWASFKAVVDEGSYAKAAERLNKSQSSISYAINTMERRLPAPVLQIIGRKAELTELGKQLYRQASNLLQQAQMLDRSAEYLAAGWESEVVIAADALVPMDRLFCALQAFSEQHQPTRVKILETTLSGTEEAIITRQAQLALTPMIPPGFLGTPIWKISMLPVAASSHPLHQLTGVSGEQALAPYRQIVIRDSGSRRQQNVGWLGSEQRWTVSHFASSIQALKAGLGYGFIPQDKIRAELASGELKVIAAAANFSRQMVVNMTLPDQHATGPATAAIADVIRTHAVL